MHEAFCLDSQGIYLWGVDDFLGYSLNPKWSVGGTGSAAFITDETGGVLRLTTGATNGNNYLVDWNDIRSLHVNKQASFETRIKLNQSTNIMMEQVGIIFDGSNAIYFRYDTNTDNFLRIFCLNGGASTTGVTTSTIDTDYHIYKIECFPAGEVHFYVDNVECTNSPLTTNIPNDAADYLQPILRLRTREDVAKSMDIDYCQWRQDI